LKSRYFWLLFGTTRFQHVSGGLSWRSF
jgi:hypothetical protein